MTQVKGFKKRRVVMSKMKRVGQGLPKSVLWSLAFSKAEYAAKIQAQHGPVRVLVKDGKPVEP